MCPRRSPAVIASLVLSLAASWGVARAQPTAGPDPVETYLADRGLDGLLATHLHQRLSSAPTTDRPAIAARLAEVYVRLLRREEDAVELARIERRCRDLLDAVPEAETSELRINLARARYLSAQETAERSRLLLADAAEQQQAIEVLRATSAELDRLATQLHRRVETLDRELRRPNADEAFIREALDESRRLRSLAFYYAGWSEYYLAVLTGRREAAVDATRLLGWILGAEGSPASPDEVRPQMLRFEHVGRAAIGCAMAESFRGEHVRAARWLEALASTPELHPAVADQMLTAQVIVYTAASRWADLLALLERASSERGQPLEPAEARLVAVLTLERLGDRDPYPGRNEIIESAAQIALGDLVQTGQIGHVLDLVQRFGTVPLGDRGFIVRYARALQSYSRARDAHAALAEDTDTPAASPEVANLYRDAAESFRNASLTEDAQAFPEQLDRASTLSGLALYLAGDAERAADALELAANSATTPEAAEEALWYALVALDHAIETGSPSLRPRRDRLALLYLTQHPGSPRAARLVLTQQGDPLVEPERAVEILLGVPEDDALYAPAQRQAARLLYALYRRAPAAQRDAAGLRFADRAERVLALTRAELPAADGDRVRELADAALLLVRQMLDALLGLSTPDIDRARAALASIEAILPYAGDDAGSIDAEIAYRRLQIAVALNDAAAADSALRALRTDPDSPFARAALQLLFRNSRERFERDASPASASAVVRHGLALLDSDALSGDARGRAVVEATAAAAFHLVTAGAEAPEGLDPRATALRLDRAARDAGHATPEAIRRIATLSESPEESLDAWRRLLAALEPGSDAWYEARYESLRILAEVDPTAARTAFDQHALLHPDLGPEPWAERLGALGASLPPRAEEDAP